MPPHDDNINYIGKVPVPSVANDFSHPICKIGGVDGVSAISAKPAGGAESSALTAHGRRRSPTPASLATRDYSSGVGCPFTR